MEALFTHAGFRVIIKENAGPDDLNAALIENDPAVVIFLGHSNLNYMGKNTVAYHDCEGTLRPVLPETIVQGFSGYLNSVRFVLIGGGESAQLGEALVAAGIQTVLCWESEASHLPPAPHSLHHHE